MTRVSLLSNPLLLGFDEFERTLEQVVKASSDSYPPYNIERRDGDRLRITLAVAGFSPDALDISHAGDQLIVTGSQDPDEPNAADRVFLHRGIAARKFRRSFVLAAGLEIEDACLDNGLLHINIVRPMPKDTVRKIKVKAANSKNSAVKKPQKIDIG